MLTLPLSRRLHQVPKNILQYAAMTIIFHFIQSIDPAQESYGLAAAIRVVNSARNILARCNAVRNTRYVKGFSPCHVKGMTVFPVREL